MAVVNVEKILAQISLPMPIELEEIANIQNEEVESFFEKKLESESNSENVIMLSKALKVIFDIRTRSTVKLDKIWQKKEKLYFQIEFEEIGTLVSMSYDFFTV